MAEYISRKEALDALLDGMAMTGYQSRAMDCVRFIPVADVAEVRHGRWIEQSPDFDLCGVAYYKCSVCGKEQQLNSHYCQFCGAKMDERSEDENNV